MALDIHCLFSPCMKLSFGLIACVSGWRWWQGHSIWIGVPGAGGWIHRRPRDWGEPGPFKGVPITSSGSSGSSSSSDWAPFPHHWRWRRRRERAAFICFMGCHTETFSNQCGGRRWRRWDGTPLIIARCAVRTGSESLIVIDHPITISIAVTTVRVCCPSWGRRQWRRRRVSRHAAPVGRLGPLHWIGGRIIASSARWRRWIFLLLRSPSGSAFWYLNVYALS